MDIINRISSSIKNKRMTLDEKINYLENLKKEGIFIQDIPKNYVSKEGIIVNNVVINIKKYFKKGLITINQIIKCENLGIKFEINDMDTNFQINYLKKAISEGINLVDIIKDNNTYKNNSIYKYINELRNKYEENILNKEQINKCINELNIIISKEDRVKILLNTVRESALKNIVYIKNINNNF